ncbi:iron complex transport system permease protein [Austwickia chelonae]|uniref:Putative ABC transporter permease protein n=1 Tax=Austwickia chelonae NBRC 105200 TaxID=1184607 RepID=K6VN51_9MICO|nr:iron ABC transporter permease [Austwickia chelonae]GAB76810.1 putative ABC transporter permease protein [Austwickia chelonae NBRC 105200]SEW31006.1 iron complex transport system permease protein [Austwickia chelonae]
MSALDNAIAARWRRVLIFLCASTVALLVSVVVSLQLGAAEITFSDVVNVFSAHVGLPSQPVSPMVDSILWDLRFPRVITAILVGAGLAVCGCALQALTRNPLAEPYLLGISSGSSAGAVAALVLGFGGGAVGLTGGAAIGSLCSITLLLLLLRKSGLDSVRIVLTGVVVGQLFSAISSLILMAAGDAEATRAVTFWLLGSMGAARWGTVAVIAVALAVGLAVIMWYARALDALGLGTDTAESIGVQVERTRLVLLVTTSVVTAAAVAGVGAIGFIGLIVPHAIRFLIGPNHRFLVPCSALGGAVLLVITDAICRVAFAPREVPVGVATALIGVPIFLVIMKKRGDL